MKLVLIPCNCNSWKCIRYFLGYKLTLINENTYLYGQGKIENLLNKMLHEFLGSALNIILKLL
jgi:hypothetical protein